MTSVAEEEENFVDSDYESGDDDEELNKTYVFHLEDDLDKNYNRLELKRWSAGINYFLLVCACG